MTGGGMVIDRMAVSWQAHGFTRIGATAAAGPGERLIDPGRLDHLIDDLLDGALQDALAATGIGRDELVCLRSVTAPPATLPWERPDADIVATWAQVVAGAVAESAASSCSSDDVVRYRSIEHAVIDLVVNVVAGDVRRAWAWRQLGLWPSSRRPEALSAAELARVAAEILAGRPAQIVAVLTALVSCGRLTAAITRWGVDRTVALVEAAWVAHGGERRVLTSDRPEASSVGPLPATLAQSTIARAAQSALAREPGTALGAPWDDSDFARLAAALAAAAVLDAEPAVVRSSPAGAVVATVTKRLLGQAVGQAGAAAPGPTPDAPPPADPAAQSIPAVPGASGTPPHIATATTAWGGLLFLVHIVGDLADTASAADAAEPVLDWPPVRPVLHRLARTLAGRALPDVEPPPPDDPAVLAFAGLAPDAAPPEPGSDREAPSAAYARAVAVVGALRARMAGGPLADAPEQALLAAVLRRSATIAADPGWLDVILDIEQTSIGVRRGGLDLDPGWVPWLGRVVRFRYV